MSLEVGGYADKLGNRYEADWVAYQLLRLLDEKIVSVTVEPLGNDETGTDVIIENIDGSLEHHQCKAGAGEAKEWSINLLCSKGIMASAFDQIKRGKRDFLIVSPLLGKQVSDLRSSALNSPEDVSLFYQHQIKVNKSRKKDFDGLCQHLNLDINSLADLEKARNLLKHFHVQAYTLDKYSVEQLHNNASKLFIGIPKVLVEHLKHYPENENKLRTKITAPALHQHLSNTGFIAKLREADERVTPVIKNLNANFEQSIRPFLITQNLIHRSELDELILSTEQNAVTLLMAEAGMGKSALLLELKNSLEQKGAVIASVRLDRQKLESNVDAFGKSLGFSYSPVHVIAKYAGDSKAVLILDQLDAVRWTTAHSDNALQVCQELVREVLILRQEGFDISIVFASRDFDISEDVALSSWLNSIDKELSKIKLSELQEDIVSKLIAPHQKYEQLSIIQQETLRTPLWLGLYLLIANTDGDAPDFSNKLELVKSYWDNRVSEVSKFCSESQVQQLINEIMHQMLAKGKLSVAESSLNNVSLTALRSLLSEGIVTSQNKQISFRHQALFDYQVGVRLYNAAQCSLETLISEIGEPSQQTLTRREHLKYALNMLLTDDSQKTYCDAVLFLLQSDRVRFHIKYLLFNSLREIKQIKAPAKKLIEKIADSESLLPYFISITCRSNTELVEYLVNTGLLKKWLTNKDNDERISQLTGVLRSIAEHRPDVVLRVVRAFVGKSKQWNDRVYDTLCWNIDKDSDEMFELRKQLLAQEVNAQYINWRTLAVQSPIKALDLLELLLDHYKEALCTSRYARDFDVSSMANNDKFSESCIEEVEKLADKIPEQALTRLLSKVEAIVKCVEDDSIFETWFSNEHPSYYDAPESITCCIVSIIERAAKALISEPSKLEEIVVPHLKVTNPVVTHLVAKILLNYPKDRANIVVSWLLEHPAKRLSCGNTYEEPQWLLPGLLIEKFSTYCSSELFLKLEEKIYYYRPDKSTDSYKWLLESRRRGMYYSYWGDLQYFLLPKLAPLRISTKAKELILVLQRRFSDYTDKDFCRASHLHSSGGFVRSPLPVGNVLSDAAWTRLILSPKARTNRNTWRQAEPEVLHESSISQFARSLEEAVINEPQRFAKLLLTLPKSIDRQYIGWLYYGLSNTDESKVHEPYKEKWEVCPVELLEEVIFHFGYESVEYELVRILGSRIAESGWSNKMIELLIYLSKHSKNPKPQKLNMCSNGKPNDPARADVGTLANNAINCCRGIAYRAIGSLYWKSENMAKQLINSVDDVISDPHPAVNYSASDLLLPLFNYQRVFAHHKFLELCRKDIRMSCIRGSYYFFNDGFQQAKELQQQYIDLVSQMKFSTFSDVQQEAGRQIVARWFFYDLFEDDVKSISTWNTPLKHGAANVVSEFLNSDKFNAQIQKLLPVYEILVNCDDKNILQKIGRSVNKKNFWDKIDSDVFFATLANSKAAQFSLWQVFHHLNENDVSLVSISSELLQLVKNVVDSPATDKHQRNISIRESDLIKTLQRLYEEASDDEDDDAINQCLDIWDCLLSAQVYSAIDATEKLDNGMLH